MLYAIIFSAPKDVLGYTSVDIIDTKPFIDVETKTEKVLIQYKTTEKAPTTVISEDTEQIDEKTYRIYIGTPFYQKDGTFYKTDYDILPLDEANIKTKATWLDKFKTKLVLAYDSFNPSSGDSALKANSTFSTARSATDSDSVRNGNDNYVQSIYSAPDYYIERWLGVFDTSTLSDSATILSAKLRFYVTNADSATRSYQLYDSTTADTVTTADYDTCGTTAYSTAKAPADFTTNAYNDYVLNASGISAISLSGKTKFCLREKLSDYDNVAPTGVPNIKFNSSINASNKPVLEVTLDTTPPSEATTTATSTLELINNGSIIFGLAILAFLLCFIFFGLLFNTIAK